MTDHQDQNAQQQLRLQQSALADFGLFAFRCNDIDSLLQRAVELVSEAMNVPLVKVLEHLPEQGAMLIRSGVNWEPGVVGHETFGDHEHSPGGYALRTERAVVSRDLDTEDRFEIPDVLRRHGVESMINVIIAGEAAPFGVLEVDSRERRDFSDDNISFLRNYANLLAAAIERLRVNEEMQRSAREKDFLARELAHRVKNLLGIIRGLAAQTSTEDRSAEDFRTAFLERLQSLSTAESLVFESGDEHADLKTLAETILAPYRQDDPEAIAIEGASIRLPARRARLFGLALHELATNAAKYGALSVAAGRVHLEWRMHRTDADDRVTMTWEETEGPEVTPPERKGFGTRLLTTAVTQELDGEADLVHAREGVRYRLAFPAQET